MFAMDKVMGKGKARSRFATIRNAVRDGDVVGTASQKSKKWNVKPGAQAASLAGTGGNW